MTILYSWLILAVAVWVTALILPGVKVKGFGGALVVAAIFGVFNWLIGWVLFVAIGVGTLGVGFILAFATRWLVMAILLKLTDLVTEKLTIKSFGWAFVAAMVMSAIGTLGEYLLLAPGGYHV